MQRSMTTQGTNKELTPQPKKSHSTFSEALKTFWKVWKEYKH